MNLREKIARALCARAGHDPEAYGFGTDQDGAQLRPKLWELYVVFAETALDCLTAPPTEAAIAAGIAMLRGNDDGPAAGTAAIHDPVGWYRRMVLRMWECMIRTMIEESKS